MSQGCTIYTDEIRECTTEAGILLSKLHSAKETADLSQGCTICTDEIRECTNKLLLHFHWEIRFAPWNAQRRNSKLNVVGWFHSSPVRDVKFHFTCRTSAGLAEHFEPANKSVNTSVVVLKLQGQNASPSLPISWVPRPQSNEFHRPSVEFNISLTKIVETWVCKDSVTVSHSRGLEFQYLLRSFRCIRLVIGIFLQNHESLQDRGERNILISGKLRSLSRGRYKSEVSQTPKDLSRKKQHTCS